MTLGDLLNDVHRQGIKIARRCWDATMRVSAYNANRLGQVMVMEYVTQVDGEDVEFIIPWLPQQFEIFAQDWALYDPETRRAVPLAERRGASEIIDHIKHCIDLTLEPSPTRLCHRTGKGVDQCERNMVAGSAPLCEFPSCVRVPDYWRDR